MINVFFLLFISLSASATTLNEFIAQSNLFHTELGSSVLEKKSKTASSGKDYFLFTFLDKNKNLYDVEIQSGINPKMAKNLIENYSSLLMLSYGDRPSPYGGIISNVDNCPAPFKPKHYQKWINKLPMTIYQSAAGARYQYGACTKDTYAYSVCTTFQYSKEKLIFTKVKYFVPAKKSDCIGGISLFMSGLKFL